jgi:GxxExxY protein
MEQVYERALANRLNKLGIKAVPQSPLPVFDEDGTLLGDYFADLLVADCLVIELKACSAITNDHVAQLLRYLRSSRIETDLLINFGSPRLYVKKFLLTLNNEDSE